jgi:hypothetical protein
MSVRPKYADTLPSHIQYIKSLSPFPSDSDVLTLLYKPFGPPCLLPSLLFIFIYFPIFQGKRGGGELRRIKDNGLGVDPGGGGGEGGGIAPGCDLDRGKSPWGKQIRGIAVLPLNPVISLWVIVTFPRAATLSFFIITFGL